MAQVVKQRKIPQRKCVACNERGDKRQLIRIVKNKEGEIFLDPTGKANGRGTYIHLSKECIERSIKGKSLEKSIKAEIPESIYDLLKEELKKSEE
ncbi:MAG: YlxR family protein [Peptostreptococcaceae bacterium]|nr:YlxR family protein [Peptostreptococcaceae bacterium]